MPEDSNEVTNVVDNNTQPDLDLVKSAIPDGGLVAPGGTIAYTLTLTNSGTAPATNVVITDAAPTNTTITAASVMDAGGTTTATIANTSIVNATAASLAVGETMIVTFEVTVDVNTPDGTVIANVASVDSDETMPEDSNETTNVVDNPNLNPDLDLSLIHI